MKAVLLILVVAVGLAAAYYQRSATQSEARMHLADEAEREAVAGLEEAEAALASAEKKIADMEKQLAAAATTATTAAPPAQVAAPAAPVVDVVEASRQASAQRAADAEAYKEKRAELERIYEANHTQIVDQLAKLTTNLEAAEATVENLRENAPDFTEEDATFPNGARKSAGVRTSAADREAVNKKHQEKVNVAMARVAAIRGEITATNLRGEKLERAYGDALKKALEEMTR